MILGPLVVGFCVVVVVVVVVGVVVWVVGIGVNAESPHVLIHRVQHLFGVD